VAALAPAPQGVACAVGQLLEACGEDVTREGLRGTPGRVARMLAEMTSGKDQDPAAILGTVFTEFCDEMILVRDIPFWSLCEHHLLPFFGTVVVGYVPQGQRVVGLSKIPRLVQCFARRLQIQERLTTQIATTLLEYLTPRGVGVLVTGQHTCMQMRGIASPGTMITSALLGVFREAPARAEFLALARG
jgi:GTP cyclohydrolase I